MSEDPKEWLKRYYLEAVSAEPPMLLPYQRRVMDLLRAGPVRLVLLGRRGMQWVAIKQPKKRKGADQ